MYIVTERTKILDFSEGRFRSDPYSRIKKVKETWNRLTSLELNDAHTSPITDPHNKQDDTSIDMVQLEESAMDLQCEDGLAETGAPEIQETQDQSNPEPEDSEGIQFIEVALS